MKLELKLDLKVYKIKCWNLIQCIQPKQNQNYINLQFYSILQVAASLAGEDGLATAARRACGGTEVSGGWRAAVRRFRWAWRHVTAVEVAWRRGQRSAKASGGGLGVGGDGSAMAAVRCAPGGSGRSGAWRHSWSSLEKTPL